MLYGIDVSNHQGLPATYQSAPWYQEASFVIVQAIDPPAPPYPPGVTAEQLRAAKEDGKYAGAYLWLWNGTDPLADMKRKLALIPDDVALDMRLWLDVEDTTVPFDKNRCLQALAVCDDWATRRGLPATGVYSGDWYVNGYMGGWFPPGRVYWKADYSEASVVLTPEVPMRQYTSNPVDKDAMLESEIVSSDTNGTVPTADELLQAMAYIKHDVLGPIRGYKYPKVKAAITEMDRVFEQYGVD
jgi:hypothetical protein